MACQMSSNNTEETIECETYTSNDASRTNTNEELYSTISDDEDNAMVKLPLAKVDNTKHENNTLTDNVDEIHDDAVSPKIDDIKLENIALTITDDDNSNNVYDDAISPIIDDTNHEDNTSASKNTNNSQSNTDANAKTNGAKQTCNTNISKSCVFVLIVAMVVTGIGSSAITALILKQEFRNDLRSIRDETESLNLNSNNDSESSWSSWTDWGYCSVTCNVGVRTRNRSCDTSDIDRQRGSCVGNDVDISTCNNVLCQANLNELQQLIQFRGSSTYVRWGMSNCPGNGTDLVYWGYAGGSHYSHSGGAVNYICLPQDPDWGYYEDALQNGGFVYGAEYEYNYRASSAKFFELHATSIANKDAPCAVCRSTRSSVLMIPGKNQCHPGWTKEYDGYLSAGSFLQAAGSEYVCVDKYAGVLSGGQGRDDNGVLFYFVEGRCGSLKCPPYVNGRELTCVVCTK